MVRRAKDKSGGTYFDSTKSLEFVPSGSVLLDCVLGGGYPLGRIVNIVGDKSTGKTLIAMEALVNFSRLYPDGRMDYVESEAAFDPTYAHQLGVPMDNVTVTDSCSTVEEWFDHLSKTLEEIKRSNRPAFYVLDSLDALSDTAELERDMDQGSYGAGKAKKLSQLFRRSIRDIQKTKMCVMIISQIRDKMGVTFGKKTTRSGGRALDFYASQVLFLAQIKKLVSTKRNVKRAVGVEIKALCEKNKVGLPFRDCEFPILFGFGIDDVVSCIEWLALVGTEKFGGYSSKEAAIKASRSGTMSLVDADKIRASAVEMWADVDKGFAPPSRKYS